MIVSAPDPVAIRAANVEELYRLRLPLPPSTFPLVWELGDEIELRATPELEARAAILNVVLARSFGMPSRLAMAWLLEARLMERVTPPEWHYVTAGQGDDHSFSLHMEALSALAWLLGLAQDARSGGRPAGRTSRRCCRICVTASRFRHGGRAVWWRLAIRPPRPRCSISTTAWTGPIWRPSAAGCHCRA